MPLVLCLSASWRLTFCSVFGVEVGLVLFQHIRLRILILPESPSKPYRIRCCICLCGRLVLHYFPLNLWVAHSYRGTLLPIKSSIPFTQLASPAITGGIVLHCCQYGWTTTGQIPRLVHSVSSLSSFTHQCPLLLRQRKRVSSQMSWDKEHKVHLLSF